MISSLPKIEVSDKSRSKITSMVCFAPNTRYPPRHGGAIRSVRLFEEFANKTGARASMIGGNFTMCIEGKIRFLQNRMSRERTPWEGAARSLMLSEHYLKAKQMDNSIIRDFLREVARLQPDVVIMHYLYSATLMHYLRDQQVYIETHNNDWEWFRNFKKDTDNPLKKVICWNSIRKTNRYMEMLTSNVNLVHVSERDKEAYTKSRPDLGHLVVPNGCDPSPRSSRPGNEDRPVRLIFVGSLSSKMNVDALNHFSKVFWPALKDDCRVIVAGFNPPMSLSALCRRNGWTLRANISDESLEKLYEQAHFAILPFPYGCGSKLKLAEACGRGLPILSTESGITGIGSEIPTNVTVSDQPEDWAMRVQSPAYSEEIERAALEFANLHSWERSASTLLESMQGDIRKPVKSAS